MNRCGPEIGYVLSEGKPTTGLQASHSPDLECLLFQAGGIKQSPIQQHPDFPELPTPVFRGTVDKPLAMWRGTGHKVLTLSSAPRIKLGRSLLIMTLQSLYCTRFTDDTAEAQRS